MNAIVITVALVVVASAIAIAVNTKHYTNQTMLKDIIGGIGNLFTKDEPKPRNIKDYISSKLELQNINLLEEFTQQSKMIESSGGTNTVNEESSARGDFQFLTEGEGNAFQTGLNRVANTYESMGVKIPSWVSKAKDHNDPIKLSSKQQEELFLANLWQQKGTSNLFKRIDEGDGLAKYQLYANYHHTNPDEATNTLALSMFEL
tara:strand:+ start:307 stop:918 length:612 start_codon:yes stop_codon:yes gene_type:complete